LTSRSFVGLGSNLGDRADHLYQARQALHQAGLAITRASAVYSAPAWGDQNQPPFLNQVVEVSTILLPHDILATLLALERSLGRDRSTTPRWGPRTIDLDLLAIDDLRVVSARLTLPHPLISERAFVLVPWAEIAPDFVLAPQAASISHLLSQLPLADRSAIHIHQVD